jgi:hypothetical protein
VLGLLAVVMVPYSLIDVMLCFVFANVLMWGYYLMQFDISYYVVHMILKTSGIDMNALTAC